MPPNVCKALQRSNVRTCRGRDKGVAPTSQERGYRTVALEKELTATASTKLIAMHAASSGAPMCSLQRSCSAEHFLRSLIACPTSFPKA
jgi:hypothetical protein